MVNELVKHETKWLAPQPLWRNGGVAGTGGANGSAWQPVILRFDNDLFMEEALALLAYYPDRLPEWVAKPETWREPMPLPSAAPKLQAVEPVSNLSKKLKRLSARRELSGTAIRNIEKAESSRTEAIAANEPLFKLYQPAHQRYYLVAASLVCQQYGFPDRRIDTGRQESAYFVLRRVAYKGVDTESKTPYDPNDPAWKEYAFVAAPGGFAWKKLQPEQRGAVAAEEERLPLFALNFTEAGGHRRRMLAGLVPVGKRESYLGAPESEEKEPSTKGEDGADEKRMQKKGWEALRALFEAQVAAPWAAMIEQAVMTRESIIDAVNKITFVDDTKARNAELNKIIKNTRDRIQTVSWYILLDFTGYLKQYLNDIWQVIIGSKREEDLASGQQKLYLELKKITIDYDDIKEYPGSNYKSTYYDAKGKETLFEALKAIASFEEKLETNTTDYDSKKNSGDWPNFFFPLTDPGLTYFTKGPLPQITVEDSELADWEEAIARLDKLPPLVEKALTATAGPLPDLRPPQLPLDPGNGWFVIRCVYERPNCGPLHPGVMSRPTEKFQMAAFFDPEAPARSVRIAMPMDISPAGLRKFKKNATLMMSDMLCGKIKRIRKLTFGDLVLSVLPWPFHKDLPDPGKTGPCQKGGMYCSLSIPIVTLAALILMIIIVSLFDIFFHWVPYLFSCFPIPGLKGKKT